MVITNGKYQYIY